MRGDIEGAESGSQATSKGVHGMEKTTGSSGTEKKWLVGFLCAFALLVGVAAAVRFVGLSTFPMQLHNDESAMVIHGYKPILENPKGISLYGSSFSGHPNFGYLLAAVPTMITGEYSRLMVRISSAVMGLISLVMFALFVNRAWGRAASLTFLAFAATYHFHVHYSRTGFHYIHATFFMGIVSYLFARAVQSASLVWAGVLGIAMGFGALVYPATQVLPFAMVAAVLLGVMPAPSMSPSVWRHPLRTLGIIGMFLMGLAISFGPQALYSYSQGTFNSRLQHTFILHAHNVKHLAPQMGEIPVNDVGVVYFNLLRTLRFFYASDTGEQYNFVENPLPLWGTALMVVGLMVLVWRSLKRDVFALYILVAALLTLTASTLMIEANFSPHLVLFTLIIPVMCSLGLQTLLKAVRVKGVALTTLVTVCVMVAWSHWNWRYYNKMMDPYRSRLNDTENWLFNLPIGSSQVKQLVNLSKREFHFDESYYQLTFPAARGTKVPGDQGTAPVDAFLAKNQCPCILMVDMAQGPSWEDHLTKAGRRVSRFDYTRQPVSFLHVE